jgi:tRNA threonylcarbamoyladenosine biosynthesis protein TsaE
VEITYKLSDIEKVAKEVIDSLTTKTLLMYGDMGIGKTTLIKAIAKLLGSKDEVSSPTFSIVNEYEANQGLIYHFDLYRIKDIEEVYNFGIEDYLFSDNWSIVEWPEKIENMVPINFDRIDIELNADNSRTLKLNFKKEINLTNILSNNK